MTTIYTLDNNGIYAGVVTLTDPYAPVPQGVEVVPPTLQGSEVARWTGAGWEVLQSYPISPANVSQNHITKLAFRNRFTMAEKVMMELAALDDPTASAEQRQQAAMLRVNLADISAATFIDLSRSDTRAGVQMLETVGLLSVGRAAEILDAPIQANERAA